MAVLFEALVIAAAFFQGTSAGIAGNARACYGIQTCNHSEPYMDASLTPAQRADDLLQRLTWAEKIGQLGGIRRAFGSVNGSAQFNKTSFDQIRSTQSGQIGMCVMFYTQLMANMGSRIRFAGKLGNGPLTTHEQPARAAN